MSAIISSCGTWRYRLDRSFAQTGKVIAFFGVNPSTADATLEDATTRKWAGFSRLHGARAFIAGNAFAFRARNVAELATSFDPVGPRNAMHLEQIIDAADILVPCWGDRGKLPRELRPALDQLRATLFESGKPVLHLGLTASGDPRHPLMLGYATPLVPWVRP